MRLQDIADTAGVSLATVSKVLNGRSDVAASTRGRIEALLQARGYSARPRVVQSRSIELVFHELDSEWAIEIIRGAEEAAAGRGLSLMLTRSGDRHAPDPQWIEGVLRRRPVGVVLVFSDIRRADKDKLRTRGVDFVVVDPAGEPDPDVASIGATNWSGGYAAAQHLIDLGHRRIGAIGGPVDALCSVARIDGYRSALERAGIGFARELVRYADFHVEGARRAAAELLELPDPPTAIFAGSDLQGFGVYEAARANNVTVPADLSVVGFDDLRQASWANPPLTTVRQPIAEMAATAVRLIADGVTASAKAPRVDLATSLILRESTAPPGF
ncbi:LacI family DNA-binding transcriptional regulator [Curtobacterium sp. ISL-83]|nr:LacI family DNA-binding transcriptional regulator [Curtobacterium sp. ISL-83]